MCMSCLFGGIDCYGWIKGRHGDVPARVQRVRYWVMGFKAR